MSHNVYVGDTIKFTGEANTKANVDGNWNPAKRSVFYDFSELLLDETNKYTCVSDSTGTVAIGSGGAVLTTQATTDGAVATISCGAIRWYPAKNPIVEMRFQVDVVTTLAMFAGFHDAASEAAATLPFLVSSGDAATDTSGTPDGAGFVFDVTATTDYWYIANTKAGAVASTILSSTYVPVAATDATIRVSIDTLGNAYYWYNGVQVGYKALAVTTTNPLIGYFGIKNIGAATHVGTLKYMHYWCDW